MKITKEIKKQLLAAHSIALDFHVDPTLPAYARDCRRLDIRVCNDDKDGYASIVADGPFQEGSRRQGLSGIVRNFTAEQPAVDETLALLWLSQDGCVKTAFAALREGDDVCFEIRRNGCQSPIMADVGVTIDVLTLCVKRGIRSLEFVLDIHHAVDTKKAVAYGRGR